VPISKVKPDSRVALPRRRDRPCLPVPVRVRDVGECSLLPAHQGKDATRPIGSVPRRSIVPLTGQARIKAGERFYQTAKDPTVWLRAADLGVVTRPPTLPPEAERGEKWIDISIRQQTLVLYEGTRPWYATLISSGRDRDGDPKTTADHAEGDLSPPEQAHRRGHGTPTRASTVPRPHGRAPVPVGRRESHRGAAAGADKAGQCWTRTNRDASPTSRRAGPRHNGITVRAAPSISSCACVPGTHTSPRPRPPRGLLARVVLGCPAAMLRQPRAPLNARSHSSGNGPTSARLDGMAST
jgi:hypothetical protein